MKVRFLFLALAATTAVSCLEQEEEITVHDNGAVTVRISASGDPGDVADGYPVPLQAPWRALDDETLAWIEQIGPDTGSQRTREHVYDASLFGAGESGEGAKPKLAVVADFASAADLPRFFAPRGEPYADAGLERVTSLEIRTEGARRVYVFERRFGARRFEEFAALDRIEEELPEELAQRLQEEEPLRDEDWVELTRVVGAAFQRSAAAFAREALLAVYTRGDASLPTVAYADALAAVEREVGAACSEERLRRLYAWITSDESHDGVDLPPDLDPDVVVREALRRSIEGSLAAAGVAQRTRFAVQERLEWAFTAFDRTVDLSDENFVVRLSLPGTVVDGNFDARDGSAVTWKFAGEHLRDADRVLRAVSVVE